MVTSFPCQQVANSSIIKKISILGITKILAMKKIFVFLLTCCLFTLAGTAQTKKSEPAKAAKSAGPTKSDGTPDMRYKANKETAKPAGPTKKDGTLDMRYKENKATATKKGKG
jgi:hypothetical protein